MSCALTLAGYMPDVLACAGCGKYDGGEFYLDPVEGRLLCADCAEKAHHITNLDNGALYPARRRRLHRRLSRYSRFRQMV